MFTKTTWHNHLGGSNGRNRAFGPFVRIKMRNPRNEEDKRLQRAVWAQEYWEGQFKAKLHVICMVWFGLGAFYVAVGNAAALVFIALSLLILALMRSAWFKRILEYNGHAVEIVADIRLGGRLGKALDREARAMRSGYNGLFAELSLDEIKGKLRAQLPGAQDFVDDHWTKIESLEVPL